MAPPGRPHAIYLMTSPYLEAYHMTKLFGAGKVGGGWGTKHVVSVPPSTPRSAAIFLPAAARNVLPQSHIPSLCSRNGFNRKGDQTGGSMGLVALVGRWVDRGGQSVFLLSPCPPHERPMPHWIPRRSPAMAAAPENAARAATAPGWQRGGAALPPSAPATPHTRRSNHHHPEMLPTP